MTGFYFTAQMTVQAVAMAESVMVTYCAMRSLRSFLRYFGST